MSERRGTAEIRADRSRQEQALFVCSPLPLTFEGQNGTEEISAERGGQEQEHRFSLYTLDPLASEGQTGTEEISAERGGQEQEHRFSSLHP